MAGEGMKFCTYLHLKEPQTHMQRLNGHCYDDMKFYKKNIFVSGVYGTAA